MGTPLQVRAIELLRRSTGDPQATFRSGQFEAIEHLLERRGPLLVVQRTGWGKSNVYFIAAKLLRERRAGPTLIVSPLLALMRNQIAAAARAGVRAVRITSEEKNREEWVRIRDELLADRVDVLLISPERLGNEEFVQTMLQPVATRIGLLVVDEAHCISDWGHDFRPDYRRITRILRSLPPNIRLLATTATANDRVVADLKLQLGAGLNVQRGKLARTSLQLQNILLPGETARLAWLAHALPKLPGSGVIYTLTIRDARTVAAWLRENGIEAEPYWGGLDEEFGQPGMRERLETRLLRNELKTLVATTALGMGFDKPDLAFVIHYQLPGSVVHYYQQVGRAGRALPDAFAVLLGGAGDSDITDHFIETAFPARELVEKILTQLDAAPDGLTLGELQIRLNAPRGRLDHALKLLALESPAPLLKLDNHWKRTAAPLAPAFWERVERLTRLRKHEQARMFDYLRARVCLMQFLARELDEPDAPPCGRCAVCRGAPPLAESFPNELAQRAAQFLRRTHHPIKPRKLWPKDAFKTYQFSGKISKELSAEEGRVLAIWGDAGWGDLVRAGKYANPARFDDRLVAAVVEMIRDWNPQPQPAWVTCVPSLNHTTLVADFAERLARALHLPFHSVLHKARATPPQKEMHNSFQQAHNLDGAFTVKAGRDFAAPVLLVDDMVDSGWTFAVCAALLRQAGCGPVFPVALAQTSKSDDT
ncbi:MAG TPA: RecQ family ATP-dependent DNA helicase [Verrucomicrobiae bacterium]|nr:RecQ family ATP-dependent DNA helicase [Verrucomicrobiae bacterium]